MTSTTHKSFACRMLRACLSSVCIMPAVLVFPSCTPSSTQYTAPQPAELYSSPTQVYFYPQKGQSPEQQDRDRYECYLWAVNKTGFDPSIPQLAPHQRIEVIPQPPAGHDTAVGAVTGAILGAMVSSPHNTGEGAAIGAVAGAVLGSVSDSARQEQAERLENKYNQQEKQQAARIEKQARNYRRALAACLEGRGYSVGSTW